MKLDDIHIEADAQVVIKAINEDSWVVQWENRKLIREIKHLNTLFNSCNFTYVCRDDNQVTNSIAKSMRVSAADLFKFDNFGHELYDLLAQYRNSRSETRHVQGMKWSTKRRSELTHLSSGCY